MTILLNVEHHSYYNVYDIQSLECRGRKWGEVLREVCDIIYHHHKQFTLAATMNLPINWFYPPDIVLVLTSDDLPPLFPPSPTLPFTCSFPWWLSHKTVMWHHLYCAFTYIRPLPIYSMSVKTQFIFCVLFYVFLSRDPPSFFIRAIHFYSYSCDKQFSIRPYSIWQQTYNVVIKCYLVF